MSPRTPDHEGFVERDGVKLAFYLYENEGPTVLLMPTWSIVHSRHWKAQIPYLARHFRVVTFDGRGNGRSDRPQKPDAYLDEEFVADAIAVLDATETDAAVLVGVSLGAHWSLLAARDHPDRVSGLVLIGPSTSLVPIPHPERRLPPFDERLASNEGWAKYNRYYWLDHYPDFAEFFFAEVFSEPHSSKQREDGVSWALETDAETLIAAEVLASIEPDRAQETLAAIRCPVLVIHGTKDHLSSYQVGVALADALGASLLTVAGGGHLPQARDPVLVNLAIKEFVDRVSVGATR